MNSLKTYATAAGGNGVTNLTETQKSTSESKLSSSSLTETVKTNDTTASKNPIESNTKSLQLLSILKKSSTEPKKEEVSIAPPPVNSGAALLSFLTKPAAPAAAVSSTVPNAPSRTESTSSGTSPSLQKTEQLLSFLGNTNISSQQSYFGSQNSSRATSPPPLPQSSMSLLTDGEIAKQVKSNQQQSRNSVNASSTSLPSVRSRGNSGSDLLAALIEPVKPVATGGKNGSNTSNANNLNSNGSQKLSSFPIKSTTKVASETSPLPASTTIPLPPSSSLSISANFLSGTSGEKSPFATLNTSNTMSPIPSNPTSLLKTGSVSGSTKKPVFLISPSDLDD